jgi:pSer/pThr/pTyr-binding forkhead associated (FHA) protein
MMELKDLASTNGVFHNGMKINSIFLKSGDEIKIGSTIIHFSNEIKFA